MENLRPKADATTLGDVLAALLRVDDNRDLEVLLKTISLEIATAAAERAVLLNAIASATARCWTRRSQTEEWK
jgi:hypothetical protein